MKVSRLLEQFATQFLIEANVYNLKVKYEKVSLEGFLESFSEHLPNAELKQMFIKKFTRLLTNDERYLYALQTAPAGAPEWARQAVEKGELFYFAPTPELENQIIDIIHYLVAVYEDTQSNDPNVKAIGTKELQGFPKAESIPLLIKKQQEYFARGSKNVKRDIEGMEEVIALPSGYTWYKLTTTHGFQREGKLLQNCIGTIWTLEKTKREKMDIYVLRDPNQNSVVGARVKTAEKELHEVKGKQNKPPVQKYMPSVQRLINDLKLTPVSGGLTDLKSAGYFFIGGRLLSRLQAIQELTTPDVLHTVGDHYITRLPINSQLIELMGEAYQVIGTVRTKVRDKPNCFIYELRDKNTNAPSISVVSAQTEIVKVIDFTVTENDNGISNYTKTSIDFIKQLRDREYVKSIDSEIISVLYWTTGLLIDKFLQSFTEDVPTHTVTIDNMLIKQYDQNTAKKIMYSFISKTAYSYKATQFADEMKSLYMYNDPSSKRFHMAIIMPTQLYPVFGKIEKNYYGSEHVTFSIDTNSLEDHTVDEKAAMFFITIANREKLKLPLEWQLQQYVVQKDDKYEIFTPTFETDTKSSLPARFIDISKIEDHAEKVEAFINSLMLTNKRIKVERAESKTNNMLFFNFGELFQTKENREAKSNKEDYVGSIQHTYTPERLKRTFPLSKMPDLSYQVTLSYGVDKQQIAGILVKNNTIVGIDKATLEHTLQRHEDVDKIAEQINQFAKEHNYKVSPEFDTPRGYGSPIQYKYDPKTSLLTTRAALAKQQTLKAQSRATSVNQIKELKFTDGTVIKPMDPERFSRWVRQELGRLTLAGLPFQIFQNEEAVCIFVVQYNTVIDVFPRKKKVDGSYEFESNFSGKYAPYIHALAKVYNWKTSKKMHLNYNKLNGAQVDFLNTVDRYYPEGISVSAIIGNRYDSGRAYDIRNVKGYANHFKKLGFIDYELNGHPIVIQPLPDEPSYEREVRTREANIHRKIKMTAIGHDIWSKITPGNRLGVDMIRSFPAAELQDFKKPEVPTEVVRAQGEPRERVPMEGGGSKSELALARFREMTQANNGTMPGRSDFMRVLQAAPFNMSAAGAQTYYYNTKAKYLQQQGQVNERMTFSQFLKVLGD